jgi:hypothetical protein
VGAFSGVALPTSLDTPEIAIDIVDNCDLGRTGKSPHGSPSSSSAKADDRVGIRPEAAALDAPLARGMTSRFSA